MTEGLKKMGITSKVICLVKKEMKESGLSENKAYEKVASTKLFELLKNSKTGLFLEPIGYIEKAYELETNNSLESMLEFIRVS